MRSLLLAVLAGLTTALAQTTPATSGAPQWQVQTVIPDSITVRIPKGGLDFAIDATNYPPVTFPTQYAAKTFPVEIFVNTPSTWNLQLQIRDIRDDSGALLIPSSHVLFRINSGVWIRANGAPQVIWSGRGATAGWQPIPIEFALELDGSERGGSYSTSAIFNALVLP